MISFNNAHRYLFSTTFHLSPIAHVVRITTLATAIFAAKELSSYAHVKNEKVTKLLKAAIYITGAALSIGLAVEVLKFSLIEAAASLGLSVIAPKIVDILNEEDEDFDESLTVESSSDEESFVSSTEESEKPKKKKSGKRIDRSPCIQLKQGYDDEKSLYQGLLTDYSGIWFGVPTHERGGMKSFLEHMQLFKDSGVKKIYVQCESDDMCNELTDKIQQKTLKSKTLNKIIDKAGQLGIDLEPINFEKGTIPKDVDKYVILAPVPSQQFVNEVQRHGIQPLAHRLKIPSVYVHSDFRLMKTEIQTNHDRGVDTCEVLKDPREIFYANLLNKGMGFELTHEKSPNNKYFASDLEILKSLGIQKIFFVSQPEDCEEHKKGLKDPKVIKKSPLLKAAVKLGFTLEVLNCERTDLSNEKKKYMVIPNDEIPEYKIAYRKNLPIGKFEDRLIELPKSENKEEPVLKEYQLGLAPGPGLLNVSAIVAHPSSRS